MKHSKKFLIPAVAVLAGALSMTGCASGSGGDSKGGEAAKSIIVGTTDVVTSLDPAGAYDNGSWQVVINVYPFLMNQPEGTSEIKPDIAESAEFATPTDYTVKLKSGLKFANGNDLTSSDVKFTFDRQIKIADPNGPSSLLSNLESVEAPDDTTVVFKLKSGNDQTFPQVLSSPAAPIVDEDSFPADKVMKDADVIKAQPFAGPYTLASFEKGNLASYKAYADYKGLGNAAKTNEVNVKYFANESNLSQAVETKAVDVAFRTLSATDVDKFRKTKGLNVVDGPGGEIRYIVFNFNTQPYGAKTPEADAAKAQAVRQASADLIDRDKIASQVYKDTYTPLYSYVPQGLSGATESLKPLYGDKQGGADPAAAKKRLEDAGVTMPVKLQLQYSPDHYGNSSSEEYAMIKTQLETDGIFQVDLQSTEWGQYSKDRVADLYPAYQLGWFPDYSDADNYLSPFFIEGNFLVNHYSNPEVQKLVDTQRVTVDPAERKSLIEQTQDAVAKDLSTLPLLQGAQVAVAVDGVDGIVLDGSFKFRLSTISKK